jgi:hypothetical protein
MKYRGDVIRLSLKRSIIMEDARRVQNREEPFNNIWRLAIEVAKDPTIDYDTDQIYKMLRRSERQGCSTHPNSNDIQPLIPLICKLLNVDEGVLITEVTT